MPLDSSPDSSIPDQLLSFRTITALLEILQDPSLTTGQEARHSLQIAPRNLQQEQHSDHRFLHAFATLLVRDTEDVAVTTKNPLMSDSPTIEIVICSYDSRDRTTPITDGPPSGPPSQSFEWPGCCV
jgi:hypothetical protein